MATRYIVLAGGDPRERARISLEMRNNAGLHPIVESGAISVLAVPECPRVLSPSRDGVILGMLFTRDTAPQRVERLSGDAWRQVQVSAGRRLIERYWGGYIAIIPSDRHGAVIVRDPSGALPCYHLRHGDMSVIASDTRDLERAGLIRPGINWALLAAQLHRPCHRGPETGLTGVLELLPGYKLSIGETLPASQPEILWQPLDYIDTEAGRSARPAELEAVVDRTIEAMASPFERVVLCLSGGLDSSIIAASLKRAEKPTHCLTFATRDADGDERVYVDIVAEALGHPVRSEFYSHTEIALERSAAAHLPRPTARTFAQGSDRLRQSVAAELGSDAVFSGDGGDNVFCFIQAATPVVDRMIAGGLTRETFRTLHDISLMSRCSMLAVARRAIPKYLRALPYQWPSSAQLLSDLALGLSKSIPGHPWLATPNGTLPGKAAHIAMLVRAQNYHEGYLPGGAATVLPLLAQPIVEHCLGIPTWHWCAGGRNRALVRAAFEDRLPASILRRRAKGGPDSFCVEIVERNVAQIRSMLLDGLLAANGLIDIDALIANLESVRLGGTDHHRLLALVDAESWARSWTS